MVIEIENRNDRQDPAARSRDQELVDRIIEDQRSAGSSFGLAYWLSCVEDSLPFLAMFRDEAEAVFDPKEWQEFFAASQTHDMVQDTIPLERQNDTVRYMWRQLDQEIKAISTGTDLSEVSDVALEKFYQKERDFKCIWNHPVIEKGEVSLKGSTSNREWITRNFAQDVEFRRQALTSLCQAIKCKNQHEQRYISVRRELERRFHNLYGHDQDFDNLVDIQRPLELAKPA